MKLALTIAVLILSAMVNAQRLAILEPESAKVEGLASAVRADLTRDFKIVDESMADAAFRSVTLADPYNLATSDARRIGEVLGVSNFILLRSAMQRRASIGRQAYFEAYAIAYVVDSRTGSLIGWFRESVEAASEKEGLEKLLIRANDLAEKIGDAVKANRFSVTRDSKFEEVPSEDSVLAKGLRTPVPYRRLRPEYTELASSYGVRATVDIEVDIDADGTIARTSIERWAGFGLEESVEKAVRTMNWRPAERNSKPLPMRILLRYNFTSKALQSEDHFQNYFKSFRICRNAPSIVFRSAAFSLSAAGNEMERMVNILSISIKTVERTSFLSLSEIAMPRRYQTAKCSVCAIAHQEKGQMTAIAGPLKVEKDDAP